MKHQSLQLKIPSPAELELDKVRDTLWRKANRNPKQLFTLIRNEAKKIKKERASKKL